MGATKEKGGGGYNKSWHNGQLKGVLHELIQNREIVLLMTTRSKVEAETAGEFCDIMH